MTLEEKLAEIKKLSAEINQDETECSTRTAVFSWIVGIAFGILITYILY